MSRPQVLGRVAVFVCVSVVILSGCGKKHVAVVNTSPISRDEFVKQLEEDYGHEVLTRIIDRALVDQAFEQAGLQFPQEKLEAVIQDWRDQAGSEAEFERALAMQGRTEADLRQAIEMGMKMELLGQRDLTYTEADLKKHYEENRALYDEEERVAFSEIVVQQEKEANDIHSMATKPGAKFNDLAKQYSIAPTRVQGGQRGLAAKEQIVPLEARDIAFALSKGQISKPFQAAAGQWYIIKLDDHRQAKKLTFEEVRERIEEDYKREHMVQPPDLMQQLRSGSQVTIADQTYADLQTLYMGDRLLDQAPGGPPGEGPQPPGTPEPPIEGPPAGAEGPPADQPNAGEGGS